MCFWFDFGQWFCVWLGNWMAIVKILHIKSKLEIRILMLIQQYHTSKCYKYQHCCDATNWVLQVIRYSRGQYKMEYMIFMSEECCFHESQTENKPRVSNVSKQVKKYQNNIHRHGSVIWITACTGMPLKCWYVDNVDMPLRHVKTLPQVWHINPLIWSTQKQLPLDTRIS